MQRFKDFTKKSGKVASAILSAAMVTSMVAGTNVVYAANTEATKEMTDVQGVNSDRENVEQAQLKITALLKDLPVNAATTSGALETAFAQNETLQNYKKRYAVTMSPVTFTQTVQSGVNNDGVATLTFNLATPTYNNDVKIEYTIDSATKRAEIAKKAVEEKLAKDVTVTNLTTSGALDTAVAEVLDDVKDGIAIYADITPETANMETKPYATKTADGKAKGNVGLTAKAANTKTVQTTAYFDKTIENNTKRAEDATKLVKDYLETELRYADSTVLTTGGAMIKTVAENYLNAKGYEDVEIATGTDTDYKTVAKESQNQDGVGTAKFRLATKTTAAKKADGTADATQAVSTDTTDVKITLLSKETKVNKALKELMTVAEKMNPTSTTTAGSFNAAFATQLNKTYKDYKQDASKTITIDATGTTANFEGLVYTNGLDFKLTYVEKDASAGKDGDPKVVITVTDGAETATDTKVYQINSAVTNVEVAKEVVEAALDNMTVTNDTTKADVEKVVNDALAAAIKAGKIDNDTMEFDVDFEKTLATADKEGTAVVDVTLYDTVNNLTAHANAEKTIKFLSNTFVEENGKKYYYDKNGNLAKDYKWLQGTDSPDGYTYYVQQDGSVMQDRLTYHPDGEHVIYFDKDGHEVFDAFVNVKKDAQGQPVDYIGYFDTFGYAYVNQTTYGNGEGAYAKDALFYINDYGVLENKGWFQNAAGEIGYAATNGTLTTSQWSLDQFGRKVYFQANGFLAKGLMTDGVKYYQLDETDGHLVGEF